MFHRTITVCIVVTIVGGSLGAYLDEEWAAFKQTYNKQYHPEDELKRRTIWENKVAYINRHNLEADRGLHTFWVGMNQFGDLTTKEFAKTMLTTIPKASKPFACGKYKAPYNVTDLPDNVDWREKGAVTPIINQGQCGSSWAFSATVSMEGLHHKTTGKLVSLSASNLMDCSRKEGNNGCCGGVMDYAFEYVMNNNGIDTTASYPYQPKDQPCKFKKEGIGATIKGCMDIPKGDEATMKKAVAMEGPVATAVNAELESFQMYKSGVYSDKQCKPQPDHGIPIVGYGIDGGKDYWLLKNSWDVTWGMKGYIMVARNMNNLCGLASVASFPIA